MLLLDAGGPILIAVFGGIIALIGFAIIWVAETLTLWLMKWASFKRCILDTFFMNLVSGVVGLPLLLLFGTVFSQMFVNRSTLPFVATWAATWAVSVGIEGGILLLFKRHPPRWTWRIAVAANTASYLLIALLIIGLSIAN